MPKTAKKVMRIFILSLFILGVTFGYHAKSETRTVEAASYSWGTIVTSSRLNIRTAGNLKADVIASYQSGTRVKCLTTGKPWVKVQIGSKVGYASGEYIHLDNGKDATGKKIVPVKPSSTQKKVTGNQVIAYAKKFLGNPYVYGGVSLTKGIDCSGFTMKIYEYFGYSLPRTSFEQRSAGTNVSSLSAAKPGDLICYNGHIALYMGNNTIIHASNARDGIKITYKADYTTILAIRRIIK